MICLRYQIVDCLAGLGCSYRLYSCSYNSRSGLTHGKIRIDILLCMYNNVFMSAINVYNNLETWRAIKKVSRKDLATAIGVNYQTVGYIERGDYAPSIQVALQVAKFFDAPVEDIFSLHEQKTEVIIKKVEE